LHPGVEPVRSLVEAFLETWQLDRTSIAWPTRRAEWVDALLERKLTLRDLIDQTRRRYSELQQPEPSTFFLYLDQGEELYVRAAETERCRFSEILALGIGEGRLRAMMSLRADFFGELQKDEPLHDVSQRIEVPPVREAQLREVVSGPAELLSARFETDHLPGDLARRTAEESAQDSGALPLLSYLLEDMWQRMIERGDGVLRLPAQSIELGRVLVQRADAFLACNPDSEEKLRHIFTVKLASMREDGQPTRRRAHRSEFSDEEWRLVSALVDHPNRLVISAIPEGGETYAEVAHEAIFRRWDKLRGWFTAEREFLAWRSNFETAYRSWQSAPQKSRNDALLMGLGLAQAWGWLHARSADLSEAEREFIERSLKLAKATKAKTVGVSAIWTATFIFVVVCLWGTLQQTLNLGAIIAGFTFALISAVCAISVHFGSRFAAYSNFIFPAFVCVYVINQHRMPPTNEFFGILFVTLPTILGTVSTVYATSSAARLRHGWFTVEHEFLAWRSDFKTAYRSWQLAPQKSRNDALLMGLGLTQARGWLQTRSADLSEAEREFIERSLKLAKATRAKIVGVSTIGSTTLLLLAVCLWTTLQGTWSIGDIIAVFTIILVTAVCTIGVHFGSRFAAYSTFILPAFLCAYMIYQHGMLTADQLLGTLIVLLPSVVGGAFAVYGTSSAARLRRGPASSSESPASSPPALVAT
jgi:hypothetical protein